MTAEAFAHQLNGATAPTSQDVAEGVRARERREILAILGKRTDTFSSRAAEFLSMFAYWSPTQPRAKLLYLLIAHKLDRLPTYDARHGGRPSYFVTYAALSVVLGCNKKTIQRCVRELHRTGPLPLLHISVGAIGRATSYSFIEDPFRYAAAQVLNKTNRHARAEQQRAAMRAAGFTDADAAMSPWIKQRETWMVSNRAPILSTST